MFPNQRGYVAGFGQAPQYQRQNRDDDQGGGGGGSLFRGRGHTLRDWFIIYFFVKK